MKEACAFQAAMAGRGAQSERDAHDLSQPCLPRRSRLMSEKDGRKAEEEAQSQRTFANLLAVIVCLVILIAGYWLMNKLWESKKLQDCVFSGRRNCAPVEQQ